MAKKKNGSSTVKRLTSVLDSTFKTKTSTKGNNSDRYSQAGPKLKKKRLFKRRKIRKTRVALPFAKTTQNCYGGLSSLAQLLILDKNLASSARRCVLSCIESMIETTKAIENDFNCWSKASLYLQTFAILVYHIGIRAGSSSGSGSAFVESSMNAIASLIDILNSQTKLKQLKRRQSSSSGDDCYKFAFCACIVICSSFSPIADAKGHFMGGSAMVACSNCFSKLLFNYGSQGISEQSNVFVTRVVGCIGSEDATELQNLILTCLFPNWSSLIDVKKGDEEINNQLNAFFNVCRWCSSKVGSTETLRIQSQGLSLSAACVDISATVDAFRRCRVTDKEMDSLLLSILQDPTVCGKIYHQKGTVELLLHAVEMLHKRTGALIPLILPLQLEDLGRKIDWNTINAIQNSDEDNHNLNIGSQFSLQLLYALLFSDRNLLIFFDPIGQ